eukprot:jgi/Mesen1/10604/ME000086S10146
MGTQAAPFAPPVSGLAGLLLGSAIPCAVFCLVQLGSRRRRSRGEDIERGRGGEGEGRARCTAVRSTGSPRVSSSCHCSCSCCSVKSAADGHSRVLGAVEGAAGGVAGRGRGRGGGGAGGAAAAAGGTAGGGAGGVDGETGGGGDKKEMGGDKNAGIDSSAGNKSREGGPIDLQDSGAGTLSRRGGSVLEAGSATYGIGWREYGANPYDAVKSPGGCINLAMAENRLSLDLMEAWFRFHPDASLLAASEGDTCPFQELAGYPDYQGTPAFRQLFSRNLSSFDVDALPRSFFGSLLLLQALADFMSLVLLGGRRRLDPANLVATTGATAALEMLAFSLADAGDAFIVPAPYYAGFDRDVGWRAQVKLVPAQRDPGSEFGITRAALEEAWEAATAARVRVRALLICSPCNPTGVVYSREALLMMLEFAGEKGIHVISDEVYAGSVYCDDKDGKGAPFVSVLELVEEERARARVAGPAGVTRSAEVTSPTGATEASEGASNPMAEASESTSKLGGEAGRTDGDFAQVLKVPEVAKATQSGGGAFKAQNVHVVYSMSKDLGFAGLRVGALHTCHPDVLTHGQKAARACCVSTQTQRSLAALLADRCFLSSYLDENRRRLRLAHDIVVDGLKSAKVGWATAYAGLYLWIDLRSLLDVSSEDGELVLFEALVLEAGLNLNPGLSFHSHQPGWFRLCFAIADPQTLKVAMQRLVVFANARREQLTK